MPALAATQEQAGTSGVAPARVVALAPRSSLLPLLPSAPPPLASTSAVAAGAAASGAATVSGLVGEAGELALALANLFERGVEAVESTVHHLQVRHTLERLENVPLKQIVDLERLKAAMHPVAETSAATAADAAAATAETEEGADAPSSSMSTATSPAPASPAASAAAQQLDAALDGVASWRLRDVVDVHTLAKALEDVPVIDPLNGRLLSREALRIRRHVHWDKVAEAVRPQPLRRALAAMGGSGGNPFSELDIRAAVGAVRMDALREVLAPSQHSRALESSGMWTWESE